MTQTQDEKLIRSLLQRGEGINCDFKREQYAFSKDADENKRSELLKDILAFANAWHDGIAYIVIGVSNDGTLVGISPKKDIDDAQAQQIINTKTNRPITFSYRTIDYLDKKLGLYTIEVDQNKRPFYIQKNWCGIVKDTVYIRRGSATEIASPDEIIEMRFSKRLLPELIMEIIDPNSKSILTQKEILFINSDFEIEDLKNYKIDPSQIPKHALALPKENTSYYREYAQYVLFKNRVEFAIKIKNIGKSVANNIKLEVKVAGFTFFTKSEQQPSPFCNSGNVDFTHGAYYPFDKNISIFTDKIIITLDRLHAGDSEGPEHMLFVLNVNRACEKLQFQYKLFSDELSEPYEGISEVEISQREIPLTKEILYELAINKKLPSQ